MPVLEYILAFLEAYDFSAEGEGAAVERGKTLISASVLGLIFEKINGYKEGSFYTPGYVTQYMAKKTVESVVLRKFSESRGRDYADLGSLSNDLGTSSSDILEANAVFDTLRIVDPAVGSGHFLVSVLNELVAAKSELGILADHKGKRLRASAPSSRTTSSSSSTRRTPPSRPTARPSRTTSGSASARPFSRRSAASSRTVSSAWT
jgi:adenine-specific DNA-methyltransferase